MRDDPSPEYVSNTDVKDINLEHVMPLSLREGWDVGEEDADTAQKLIGNMVLLRTRKNLELGNCSFEEKRAAFRDSSYAVTKTVASYEKWGLEEIRHRQAGLAKIAVKTWSLDFKK